jgi:uncharacterized protein (DUF427 family)
MLSLLKRTRNRGPKGKMKAVVGGVTIAESDETIDVAGVTYFPPGSIKRQYFARSDLRTTCVYKGEASYYDIMASGKTRHGRTWYYPSPSPAYRHIKGYVAFYGPRQGGVEVVPAS